jgi:hypothetical protein
VSSRRSRKRSARVSSASFTKKPTNCADLFRDLRDDTRRDTDRALDLLDAHCGSDADWTRAEDAAAGAVEAAYEEYVAALNEMGVDAKSVC